MPTVVGAPALWSGLDGGIAAAGDGMRIGIIDDGIDMTRPSFSGAGYNYPPGFPKGIRSGTNGKIIVARAFAPPGGSARMRTAFDPDGSEHGTHVAGIAAGLSGITGTSLGVTITNLSGVAPHAYLGSYRVLTTPTPRSASTATAPRSRAPSTAPWPTAWTCSTSRSASPRWNPPTTSSPAPSTAPRAPAS